MATLVVRGVPDHVYQRLSRLANARNRSLTAQVIALIEAALAEDEARRKQSAALDALIRGAWTPPPGAPDVVTMLREIRGSPDDSGETGGALPRARYFLRRVRQRAGQLRAPS